MNHRESLPVAGYQWLNCRASHLQSVVLLIMRLAWGLELYQSGYGHLHHVEKTAEFFRSLGIPAATANVYISGTTEMVGGLLLMFGLASRLVSLPVIFNFIVAYLTASIDDFKQLIHGGQLIGPRVDPGRLSAIVAIIDDTAFPFLITALVILAFGPGKVSLDYLLQRLFFSKSKSNAH